MKKLLSLIVILGLGFIGYALLRPLFIDDIVDENFPAPTTDTVEGLLEEEGFVMPTKEDVESMTEQEVGEIEKAITEKMKDIPDIVVEEPMQAAPELLKQGSFQDADAFHKGSGQAKIFRLVDQSRVLRFENFSSTNGPDLKVWLVQDTNGDVDSGYYSLGKLKGNKGNQNYSIPDDVNIDEYNSVIIWCEAFSVLFSTATLN